MKKILISLIVLVLSTSLLTACRKDDATTRFDKNSDFDASVQKDASVDTSSDAVSGSLEITSFTGDTLATSRSYQVVSGVAPEGTHRIKINNYVLTKYTSGARHWSYIAATYLNTLESGKNDYRVTALNKAGQEIDEANFSIDYTPPVASVLPKTGGSLLLSLVIALMVTSGWTLIRQKKA